MNRRREFKLGEWRVTPLRGVVHGPQGTRRITPKSMDVLLCLVEHRGDVVDRETFLNDVWHGRAFSDEPLNKCIAELRRQLGDKGAKRKYIETIPKRGYRLIAGVSPVGGAENELLAPKTNRWLRIAAIALLALLASFGVMQLKSPDRSGTRIAIAVLPFENLSGDDKAYFADGVQEELITELSQSSYFAVRSRTSTLQFRNSQLPLPEIAERLDADVIVEGSVRHDNDRIRVTAQLIDAASDVHLWAGNIEKNKSMAEFLEIQEEIAREISSALRVSFRAGPDGVVNTLPTKSIEAYEHFMLGKYHYRRKLPGDVREAVTNFETAVALDPEFAEGWDWLAYAYNHAATDVGDMDPEEAYPKARSAALRALELQPDLATAMSILGYIRAIYDRDWIGAETVLERAVTLSPGDSGTVWSLAHVYSMLGRHDEALQLTREFAEQEPPRGRRYREYANRLLDAGRYDEALVALDTALRYGAEPAQLADARGTALTGLHRYGEAAEAFEIAVAGKQRHDGAVARLAFVYGKLGRGSEARGLLQELQQRTNSGPISLTALATAHLAVDDRQGAIKLLAESVERRDRESLFIPHSPFYRDIRSEDGFRQLVNRLNLPSQ